MYIDLTSFVDELPYKPPLRRLFYSTPGDVTESGKQKHSALSSTEPTRRSLRRMGINPESRGFPYYSPSKLRDQSVPLDDTRHSGDSVDLSVSDKNFTSEPLIQTVQGADSQMRRQGSFEAVQEIVTNLFNEDDTSSQEVIIDILRLQRLFQFVLSKTVNSSVDELLQLHSQCTHIIFRYRMKCDKSELVEVCTFMIMSHFNNFVSRIWRNIVPHFYHDCVILTDDIK